MVKVQEFEFRTMVSSGRRITIPKPSGVCPGDFVIVKIFKVFLEKEKPSEA